MSDRQTDRIILIIKRYKYKLRDISSLDLYSYIQLQTIITIQPNLMALINTIDDYQLIALMTLVVINLLFAICN